jgi:hypothetical protein
MFRIGMALIACAMIGIVGCGSKSTSGGDKDKKGGGIVGTWEATLPEMKGVTLVMTFTADGKFSQETVIEGMPQGPNMKIDNGKEEGTYKLQDKTITKTVNGKDSSITIKELTETKAVFANEKGIEVSFTKKK